MFLGAPAASAPAERADRADRPSSVPNPVNGPIVFDWYSETFVVEPSHPRSYYETPFELQVEIPSVSPDGRFLAWPGFVPSSDPWGECCELFVAELDGDHARQLTDELQYPGSQGAGHSAWSPDGRQIVVEYGGGRLWIFEVRTGELVQRLTDDASEPVWSPDGRLIAFQAGSPGPGGWALFTIRPDGTHLRQLTRPSAAQFDTEADWSPDGRWLLFRTNRWASPDDNNETHLALVSRDGDAIRQLTHNRRQLWFEQPTWSPDGRKIAVARQKPVRRGQPYDGEGTLAIYRADGTFLRWVEGPWTQDMDDFHWPSIDWASRPPVQR